MFYIQKKYFLFPWDSTFPFSNHIHQGYTKDLIEDNREATYSGKIFLSSKQRKKLLIADINIERTSLSSNVERLKYYYACTARFLLYSCNGFMHRCLFQFHYGFNFYVFIYRLFRFEFRGLLCFKVTFPIFFRTWCSLLMTVLHWGEDQELPKMVTLLSSKHLGCYSVFRFYVTFNLPIFRKYRNNRNS